MLTLPLDSAALMSVDNTSALNSSIPLYDLECLLLSKGSSWNPVSAWLPELLPAVPSGCQPVHEDVHLELGVRRRSAATFETTHALMESCVRLRS